MRTLKLKAFLSASLLAIALAAPSAFAHYHDFYDSGHGERDSCPCDNLLSKVKKA